MRRPQWTRRRLVKDVRKPQELVFVAAIADDVHGGAKIPADRRAWLT
jgi:hypothetical protein